MRSGLASWLERGLGDHEEDDHHDDDREHDPDEAGVRRSAAVVLALRSIRVERPDLCPQHGRVYEESEDDRDDPEHDPASDPERGERETAEEHHRDPTDRE